MTFDRLRQVIALLEKHNVELYEIRQTDEEIIIEVTRVKQAKKLQRVLHTNDISYMFINERLIFILRSDQL